jgi:hypothetical protein
VHSCNCGGGCKKPKEKIVLTAEDIAWLKDVRSEMLFFMVGNATIAAALAGMMVWFMIDNHAILAVGSCIATAFFASLAMSDYRDYRYYDRFELDVKGYNEDKRHA